MNTCHRTAHPVLAKRHKTPTPRASDSKDLGRGPVCSVPACSIVQRHTIFPRARSLQIAGRFVERRGALIWMMVPLKLQSALQMQSSKTITRGD